MKTIINTAHGGEGWTQRGHAQAELGVIWSKCGVRSETDDLRSILVRSPGKEIDSVTEPEAALWNAALDPQKAREQHEKMVELYKKYHIDVHYVDHSGKIIYPNLYFMRDTFAMTKEGAIMSRMASPVRAGEEVLVQKSLADLGIPIIMSAYHDMVLEGPDILIVNEDLVLLGVGLRTNMKAAELVKYVLSLQGFQEIVIIQTTYGCGHLDGVLNLLNKKTAVICPKRLSFHAYEVLCRHGFRIVELMNPYEIDELMSINFVVLNDETLVMNRGAQESVALYQKAGMHCEELDVSELMKGGGSVHCMTGVLWRA